MEITNLRSAVNSSGDIQSASTTGMLVVTDEQDIRRLSAMISLTLPVFLTAPVAMFITGQNPASGGAVADLVLATLKNHE